MDLDEGFEVKEKETAAAYYNRGVARKKTGGNSLDDFRTSAHLSLKGEGYPKKEHLEKALLGAADLPEEHYQRVAFSLLNSRETALSFLRNLSSLDDEVLSHLQEGEGIKLGRCLSFGNRCNFIVHHPNRGEEGFGISPSYRLAEVRGKTIFGGIKPMLRDNQGKIIAVPKITEDGGRTCWLPDLGIELKGIGTIHGRPKGDYGKRTGNEDPDPIGGMLLDKAIYEYLATVYLYIAGVDVPEPLGVARPYGIRGPNGKPLAVFAKRPKTPLRGSDLLSTCGAIPSEVEYNVKVNLQKMHYLGLVHSWFSLDNFNAEGQLLDLEGVRIAVENESILKGEENNVGEGGKIGKQSLKQKIHVLGAIPCYLFSSNSSYTSPDSYTLKSLYKTYIDSSLVSGTRLMPNELTDTFAFLFTDKELPSKESLESMRDPRDFLGRFAESYLDHSQFKVRETAQQLYGRYRTDLEETARFTSRFQKEVDFVKKNFCPTGY